MLFVGQSATTGTTAPGSAVFTQSAAFGRTPGADAAEDDNAHVSSLARHGFSVFARPPVTPTIPNAWLAGYDPPHCGHEMSLPVVDADGPRASAGSAPTARIATARVDAPSDRANLLICDSSCWRPRPWPWVDARRSGDCAMTAPSFAGRLGHLPVGSTPPAPLGPERGAIHCALE